MYSVKTVRRIDTTIKPTIGGKAMLKVKLL
jgi:hypothetical protein